MAGVSEMAEVIDYFNIVEAPAFKLALRSTSRAARSQ